MKDLLKKIQQDGTNRLYDPHVKSLLAKILKNSPDMLGKTTFKPSGGKCLKIPFIRFSNKIGDTKKSGNKVSQSKILEFKLNTYTTCVIIDDSMIDSQNPEDSLLELFRDPIQKILELPLSTLDDDKINKMCFVVFHKDILVDVCQIEDTEKYIFTIKFSSDTKLY